MTAPDVVHTDLADAQARYDALVAQAVADDAKLAADDASKAQLLASNTELTAQLADAEAEIAALKAAAPSVPLLWVPGQRIVNGFYQANNTSVAGEPAGAVIDLDKFYVPAEGHPAKLADSAGAKGHAVHFAFALNTWSGSGIPAGTTAPTQPTTTDDYGHPYWGYDDVLAGHFDPVFEVWKAEIKALQAKYPGIKIVGDMSHEPDVHPRPSMPKYAVTNYSPAMRYMVNDFEKDGVHIEWAVVYGGFQVTSAPQLYKDSFGVGTPNDLSTLKVAKQLWLASDLYLHGNADPNTLLNVYNQVQKGLLGPAAAKLPFMLGEWGIDGATADRKATLAKVAAVVKGKVGVMEYFSSGQYAIGANAADYVAFSKSL